MCTSTVVKDISKIPFHTFSFLLYKTRETFTCIYWFAGLFCTRKYLNNVIVSTYIFGLFVKSVVYPTQQYESARLSLVAENMTFEISLESFFLDDLTIISCEHWIHWNDCLSSICIYIIMHSESEKRTKWNGDQTIRQNKTQKNRCVS